MATYHKDDLRKEIRRLRGLFYTHPQIIEHLRIPEQTYWYHWRVIKHENAKVYDKLTEENIREDVERTIAGIEKNIQQLQEIIDNPDSQEVKIKAIETRSELMSAIPRMRQQGGAFIATLESGDINRGKQEEIRQARATGN